MSLRAGSQAVAGTRAGQLAWRRRRRRRRPVPAQASDKWDYENRDGEAPEERFVVPEGRDERAQTRAISDEPAGEAPLLREDAEMRP